MEKYKKKSLNFMGFSRELRKTQRDNQRCISRNQRFSIIRSLEDQSITEENKINDSRIPSLDHANSRIEMLQKWKQEKMVKKQQESKLKKPAFKVGVIKPPNPPPSLGSKPLFALGTSSRLFKSSFQVSNSLLSGKKQESLNASNTKTNAKVCNSQASAKKPEVDTVNIKTSAKDMKIQSSISKVVVPSKPESKWIRNKESGIQSLNTKPKVDTKSKVVNKDQLSSNRKQPTIGSKPPLETKKVESRLQPLNVRSKVTSLVRDTKSNIPSSGLPKATASRTLSTESKQAIPKKNNAVKGIPKFSKMIASQQKGNISEKTSRSESKVTTKPESDYLTNKPNKVATFECELSLIEPVKEQRKSFAPPGFMFQPPVELNSSLFFEDGPSAIFLRMKNQFLRTSTPKQSPSSQKSSSETKDSKCLENEDIKCTKDESIQCPRDEEKIEDIQCSKNADNKLGSSHKYDLEALLSSSLESVYLNDVKPIDCKQSLKFEFPEVVSTRNQEVLLSSKITHPELSLATEPTPGGAMNPPILPDSVEIDKTEINSTDTRPADDNKINIPLPEVDSVLSEVIPDPTYTVKPIDCKRSLKFKFPEVISTQNQEEVLLSSKITYPELSLATEPTPGGAINPPILHDSVEIDKTEINSTDTRPADDNKITILFSEVDSVLSEVISDPTYTVKPIDCKQSLKFEFSEIVSKQNQEEVFLSSNIMHTEHSLAREPTPGEAINPPILPDSVEIDKTEINSTDPECNSKITVPFPEVVSGVIPDPTYIEPDENTEKNRSVSNGFLHKQENGFIKIPERKIRNFRRGEKPGLTSINESLENTPRSALKNKVLDSVFTPRRSLRLAKLSGNFRSLENLLHTPKPKENKDKAGLKDNFTPRRSSRLSKFSTEFSSVENLFDVRRPTLYGTPEKDEVVPKVNSRVTYDFDRLSSETEEETHPRTTRGGKVSLLYTPPNKLRPSIMRHSIKGDLMSFSPNV